MADEIKGTITRVRVNSDEYSVGSSGGSTYVERELLASKWTETMFKSYEYSIEGIADLLGTNTATVDVLTSSAPDNSKTILENWSYIYNAITTNGGITFYAYKKPNINLNVVIRY